MGSPLGPTFANIFMNSLEETVFDNCPLSFHPLFYKRYVDDTFALFKRDFNADSFLEFINAQHPNIRFTVEKETRNSLSFLDLRITRENNGFQTSIHRKNTFTGLGTNFYSSCNFNFKLNSLSTLLHRAYSLTSSWTAFHKEVEFLANFFRNNCFPSHYFHRVLNKLLTAKMKQPIPTYTVPKLCIYAKFPFLHDKSFKKKCMNLIHHELPAVNLKLIPRNPLNIRSFFRVKDRLSPSLTSNIIYKYTCPRCSLGTYVGCTRRLLKVRFCSHQGVSFRTGCTLSNPELSNVRNHSKICGTRLDINDFKIIGSARKDDELMVLESLFIKTNVPTLNTQSSSTQLFIA